ncbi:MAG: hypothetical protein QM784_33210 [Polyangiaceae bacterium]
MAAQAPHQSRSRRNLGFIAGAVLLLAGCGAATTQEAAWPGLSKKWYDRAAASFMSGDVDDATLAVDNALRVDEKRSEIRILAAKVALAKLDFDRVIQLTEGERSAEADSIRGRALWYSDRIQEAADVLERLVADPEVRDPWAVDIAKLARRGIGRKPFSMSGGLLAVSEMPRLGRSLLVPIELDGEPALAMVATGVPETVIDATAGAEPKWVSLRFGERVEVKDVPALTKDLSGYSRQLNAPVKVLLGVNLLRRLRPTFDFLGGQFVVRSYEPPQPPTATTVPVSYIRGGGMLLRSNFGSDKSPKPGALLIDTTMDLALVLDDEGWKKTGKNLAELQALPGTKNLTVGLLDQFALGSLEIPGVPAARGVPIAEIEKPLGMDLDGIIGSGMFVPFRVTLADQGRTMWVEPMPMVPEDAADQPEPASGAQGTLGGGASAEPAPASAPEAKPGVAPKAAGTSGNGAKGNSTAKKAAPTTNSK